MKNMVLPFVNVIALFLAIQPAALAFHDSLGFLLAPRARACFFEPFAQPQQPQMQPETKIVDVFVQSGGKANLKLQIFGPLGAAEIDEERFEAGVSDLVVEETLDSRSMGRAETDSFLYEFAPKLPGTYAVCLDNTIAHLMPKFVQVDVYPKEQSEGSAGSPIELVRSADGGSGSGSSSGRAMASLARIRRSIAHIQLTQHHDRHRQQLHSELNRTSHNGLVYGAIGETVIYIMVSMFQVFFVRRWFNRRSGGPSSDGGARGAKMRA